MTLTYMSSEIRRIMRNRRYMIFSLVMPVILILVFGSQQDQLGGISASAFYMVGLATFGAMGSVFSGGSRVSFERSIGWSRQLRLTALKGWQYVVAKLSTSFVTAIPAVLAVFAVSAIFHGVRLSAFTWVATALAVIIALIPIGVMGIALGYLAKPDALGPITGGLFMMLSIVGGVWYPITQMPGWMQFVAKALPMTWSTQAGQLAVAGHFIPWNGVAVLVGWTLAMAALAAWAYRRDTYRA